MKHSLSRFVWLAVLVALQLCLSTAPLVSSTSAERVTQPQVSRPAPITIAVDATDAPRKILHARLVIPVKSGPLTLFYPKWIPGEHGPTGPITDLAGLKFAAAGKTVAWRRDDVDMYTFHLDVPSGANKLDVTLDFLLPASAEGFSSAASTTANLAVISWNQVLLYPEGHGSDDLTYLASLRLPAGWKYGTALPIGPPFVGPGDGSDKSVRVGFKPVSLTTLVDSPVIAGSHYRALTLTDGDVRAKMGAMPGGSPVPSFEIDMASVDAPLKKTSADLLPHEFVHSWNGKYRRPAGLATADYQQPMKGELLWVYEGLTEYLGSILAARTGLRTPEDQREHLAGIAAYLDRYPGRTWRPLSDTAIAAQLLYNASNAWFSWRRGVDYYDEGELIWLEADTIIRQQTKGARSLDDFCKSFHGAPSGPPMVKPYTFDDVVRTMNQVAPYDWRTFFTTRLNSTDEHAPLNGIINGGWRLIYNDVESDYQKALEEADKSVDFSYSLGLRIGEEGAITDVVPGTPAYVADIGPGMKIISVNGRAYSSEALHEAVRAAKNSTRPIELTLRNGASVKGFEINYYGGERYPHLEREPSRPDLLAQIIRPVVPR